MDVATLAWATDVELTCVVSALDEIDTDIEVVDTDINASRARGAIVNLSLHARVEVDQVCPEWRICRNRFLIKQKVA